MSPRSVILASRISGLRRERGLTQAQLAASAGVGVEALRKLEQGRVAQPGLFRIVDLAVTLETTVEELLRPMPRQVGSVGYEGTDIGSFVSSIRKAEIDLVADIRLTPVSRKKGFSKNGLREALADSGVQYRHLPSLGNPKQNRPLFAGSDLDVGRARYRAGLRRPEARAGLADLARLAGTYSVAVLCFEADARRCHRAVVLEELAQLG